MAAVIGNGMSGEDPAHEQGNPTRSAAHAHMGMVAHQSPGINGCLGFVGHPSYSRYPILSVQIVIDNVAPLYAANDDVVQGTRGVQPCAAWHLGQSPLFKE